jgi:DNA-binding NtrC family response regulator
VEAAERRAIEVGGGGLLDDELGAPEEVAEASLVEAPDPRDGGVVVFEPGVTMEEMERRAIAAALAEVHGNRRKAAELLGIGERTLYRKISKYDLDA